MSKSQVLLVQKGRSNLRMSLCHVRSVAHHWRTTAAVCDISKWYGHSAILPGIWSPSAITALSYAIGKQTHNNVANGDHVSLPSPARCDLTKLITCCANHMLIWWRKQPLITWHSERISCDVERYPLGQMMPPYLSHPPDWSGQYPLGQEKLILYYFYSLLRVLYCFYS